jgi:hypothetical protein
MHTSINTNTHYSCVANVLKNPTACRLTTSMLALGPSFAERRTTSFTRSKIMGNLRLMFCALKLTATALRIAFQRSSAAAQM